MPASANRPQCEFLTMPHKYRLFCAGYGCLRDSTEIITGDGLVPIADITRSTQVLSMAERTGQLEYCQCAPSFPKGKANLYRIVTEQEEFVASESHRLLCVDGKYQPVQSLNVGQRVFAFSENLLSATSGVGLLSSLLDGQRLTGRVEDCQLRCEGAVRRYGQQLLLLIDNGLSAFPVTTDVHKYVRDFSLLASGRVDGAGVQRLKHIHRDLLRDRKYNYRLVYQSGHLGGAGGGYIAALLLGYILANIQAFLKFVLMCEHHHKEHGLTQLFADVSCLPPKFKGCTSTVTILAKEQLKSKEYFWDIQVAKNHNYITKGGAVHHNSGKTWIGSMASGIHYLEHPKVNQGYFAPTYPHIRDIFFPTIEEAVFDLGLTVDIKEGNKEVHFYTGKQYRGTTICRSMEKPHQIIGFKIGHAMIDEIDVLPTDKATVAWRKIIARMRVKDNSINNGVDVTTTPEGFKFAYNTFVAAPNENPALKKNYGLIQASTYENEKNLPADYIESLIEIYPEALIEAYLNGQFVNLTTGTVYRNYDRVRCGSTETIKENEVLNIGMDFNVSNMAATVYVVRENGWHAVDELTDIFDTPDMVRIIQDRFDGHKIKIYPDASGNSRKSVNASISDLALLTQAGLRVMVNPRNPLVKDRVNATNKQFELGRLWVNAKKCPTVAKCFEQQSYDKNGEPDKKNGFDHQNDASTYPIAFEFPINKPLTTTQTVRL